PRGAVIFGAAGLCGAFVLAAAGLVLLILWRALVSPRAGGIVRTLVPVGLGAAALILVPRLAALARTAVPDLRILVLLATRTALALGTALAVSLLLLVFQCL